MSGESERDKYIDDVMVLSQFAWENRINRTILDRWLQNFDYERERVVTLEMLSKFVYFAEEEILRLCEVAFQKLLVRIGSLHDEKIPIDLAHLRTKYQTECRFFGVGHSSESGAFLLYPFRQRNSLPQSLFPDSLDEIDPSAKFIVCIDDVIASGETACGFWREVKRLSLSDRFRFFYLSLLAYDVGIQEVERDTEFEVIACQVFDDSCRAFADESCVFPDKDKREKAKGVSEKYGKMVYPPWPLGFSNLQGLVGFHHNVPDTTLPIIWAKKRARGNEKGWFPIFERHIKK